MSTTWPNKLIIGLTGNIATGKSAILHMAADEGALVLDADKIVHQLMAEDADIQAAIAREFGESIRKQDGRINRAALGAIVFRDPARLRSLEGILHPAVRERIKERIEASDASIVMIEAIKLLEGPLAEECDQIWVADCPPTSQIERLIVCRGMDWETAATRIHAQPPQEEKLARADVVIDTEGSMADTRSQFEMAWSRLPAVEKPPAPTEAPAAEPAQEEKDAPPQRTPPQRLTAAKASELRQKLQAKPAQMETDEAAETAPPPEPARPDDLTVRRARPSDVPSILLLIQRATAGAVKMKRAELLLALSERSYLISQAGSEISAVVGWNTENLVARIDQIYIHPLEAAPVTGAAALAEIEASAEQLICEAILAFLTPETPQPIRQMFVGAGFNPAEKEDLPRAWQSAVEESQPAGSELFIKVLRERPVTQPM